MRTKQSQGWNMKSKYLSTLTWTFEQAYEPQGVDKVYTKDTQILDWHIILFRAMSSEIYQASWPRWIGRLRLYLGILLYAHMAVILTNFFTGSFICQCFMPKPSKCHLPYRFLNHSHSNVSRSLNFLNLFFNPQFTQKFYASLPAAKCTDWSVPNK